jgi:hypothetical protein
VWEQAAVAVQQREAMLNSLLLVQQGVEEGSIGYLTISALERECVRLVQVRAWCVLECGVPCAHWCVHWCVVVWCAVLCCAVL